MPSEPGRSYGEIIAAVIGCLCIAAFAALARWLWWWPHSDIRQLGARAGAGLFAVVGFVMLVGSLVTASGRTRAIIVAVAAGSALLGALAGLPILHNFLP